MCEAIDSEREQLTAHSHGEESARTGITETFVSTYIWLLGKITVLITFSNKSLQVMDEPMTQNVWLVINPVIRLELLHWPHENQRQSTWWCSVVVTAEWEAGPCSQPARPGHWRCISYLHGLWQNTSTSWTASPLPVKWEKCYGVVMRTQCLNLCEALRTLPST